MYNRIFKWVAAATFTGTLATGCASTSVTKAASAAPITYRIGQGDAQYASLDRSHRSKRPNLPKSYEPVGGQGRDFDPKKIDRTLYSHQKVGKRYTIMGRSYTPKHNPDYNETGAASWYGPGFHGKPTANGETFNKNAMTAAHKTLPLNSMVRVTNLNNGRSVTVRLNDRGPFIGDRIIDMSEAGAVALGFKQDGVTNVRVRYLGPADPSAGTRVFPKTAPRVAALPRENLTPRPRYAAPKPIAPRSAPPRLAELPPLDIAPAPRPVAQPLPSLPQYQAPNPAPMVPTPAPRYAAPSLPSPMAPGSPRRAPEADLPSGGDITMTIKGPIHIAGFDEADAEPEFIFGPLKTK
ncbi:MAG: septal ring lytic transglycosylase RlpA family protein [Litorimonas sp.]